MKKYARFFALLCLTALFALSLVTLSACNDEPAPPAFVKASESADGYATVYIENGGELDVMVLSDPQVDYTEKYKVVGSPGNDVTYSFIEDFVAATDPDLVVINGDLVMLDTLCRDLRAARNALDVHIRQPRLRRRLHPRVGNSG